MRSHARILLSAVLVASLLPLSGCFGRDDSDRGDGGSADAGDLDGGGGVCDPGTTQSCTCTDGTAGTQQCAADGSDWESCTCAGPCESTSLAAAGTLAVDDFTIDYTGGVVSGSSAHKLDADPQEDGCIADVSLDLALQSGGCALNLSFGPYLDAFGGLVSVVLEADSLCPGFLDAEEGTYRSEAAYGGWWYLGPTEVTAEQAAVACLSQITIEFPDSPIRMLRAGDGRELFANLSDITLTGNLLSTGDTTLSCPTVECAPGLHDGGTGWCIAEGICSAGYHDGGDGVCQPAGTCSSGYQDDGTGLCVPPGLCAAGYHDGGDGTCVPEGTCVPGHVLDGFGDCVAVVPCRDGVRVAPRPVDFGSVAINTTALRAVSITNPAVYDPCTVTGISLAGGTPSEISLAPGTAPSVSLRPGQTYELDVQFLATSSGSYSGFLVIGIDDGNGTTEYIKIDASAVDLPLAFTPSPLDFGVLPFGCGDSVLPACVRNDAVIDVTVTQVQVSGSSELTLAGAPAVPFTLAPGEQACFDVQYAPIDTGSDSGSLALTVFPSGEVHTLALLGESQPTGTATDLFQQLDEPKADILWVIDDSCSMQPIQASLASQTTTLIDFLTQENVDYQIGVVNTDATTNNNDPGLLEPQDRRRPHIVVPTMSNPAGVFAQNVQLGTDGSATETGFTTAQLALSDPKISDPAANLGFLRTDATLAVIFVSDEDEQSAGTVQSYLDFFRSIHGASRPELFVASAVVDTGDPSCVGSTGGIGPRYIDIANRTGGAVECVFSPDWSATMQGIAQGFALVSRFPLTQSADSGGTITVVVTRTDGTTYVPAGWSYDTASNAIDFLVDVPQPNESIRVTYPTACQ